PNDHYGRPSFKRVLLAISDAYREKNGEVVEQARMVESALSNAESFAGRSGEFSPKVINQIVESAMKMFDPRNGGFGTAPKFPHPAALDLLMDQYVRTGDEKLRDAVVISLEKMAHGGVYDQLAGGFHRYSVDERWVVPHFEKMCYDNSELLKNYVRAYQVTGSEFFAEIARDIIRWMDEWLSDREHGGFYGSQDADYSLDDDGDYFTWTLDEARQALSEDELKVAASYYDIGEAGEMHHNPAKNVLFVNATLAEGWSPDSGLRHVIAYSHPQSQLRDVRGLLDDYAFTVNACLDAYETTADLSYFNFAQRIADAMLSRFYDETGGGFFDTQTSF